MERIESQLTYYRFRSLADVNHGVFTRYGGVSVGAWGTLNLGGTVGDSVEAVTENHRRIYQTLGVAPESAVTVWMVHRADTAMALTPLQGRRWLAKADAVITNQRGITLVMRYADCTPILVYDPHNHAIGIAHAGWQGTVQGMAYNLIRSMVAAYGSRPQDLLTAIAPAIGPDRYQVGEEVVDAVQAHFGTLNGLVKRDTQDGTAYLNLWEANARDLARAGVKDSHIEIAGMCTATRTDEFYSHRAEKGKTGRFGVAMALP